MSRSSTLAKVSKVINSGVIEDQSSKHTLGSRNVARRCTTCRFMSVLVPYSRHAVRDWIILYSILDVDDDSDMIVIYIFQFVLDFFEGENLIMLLSA